MRRRTLVRGAAVFGAAVALTAGTALPAAAHGSHGSHDARGYVALGDSYTSGPAIPVQVDANCARSSSNYPSLVTAQLRRTTLTDVSCAGATTTQMWQAQGTNPPQLDAVTKSTDLVSLQIGGNDIGFGTIIGTCA